MGVSLEVREEVIKKTKRILEGKKDISDEEIKDIASKTLTELTNGSFVKVDERLEIVNYVFNSMRKLGVLQPILDDSSVTEVMINGPKHIFIERNGRLSQCKETFTDEKELEDIIQRIVYKVNRTVDSSNPICDARLEDGSRVNIVLPPIALNGATVTIRKFPEKVINFQDLISWGAISEEVTLFLEKCVKAKYNIFVSGGTGSGKTTLVNVKRWTNSSLIV